VKNLVKLTLKSPPDPLIDHAFERIVMQLLGGTENMKVHDEEAIALDLVKIVEPVYASHIHTCRVRVLTQKIDGIFIIDDERLSRVYALCQCILTKFQSNEVEADKYSEGANHLRNLRDFLSFTCTLRNGYLPKNASRSRVKATTAHQPLPVMPPALNSSRRQ
jgi:hypothetical protein